MEAEVVPLRGRSHGVLHDSVSTACTCSSGSSDLTQEIQT